MAHRIKIEVLDEIIGAINLSNAVMQPCNKIMIQVLAGKEVIQEILPRMWTKEFGLQCELVNDKKRIEIFFHKSNKTYFMPRIINANLVKFLRLYKPEEKPRYSCLHFIYEMIYGRGVIEDDYDSKYVFEDKTETFNESKLVIGDIVHLYTDSETPPHFALYIADGFYLSLFGTIGPLVIATLDMMKKFYGLDSVIRGQKIKNIIYS